MPRKYTSRNHDHPHYQLKDFLQSIKKRLRSLSAKDLQAVFDTECALVIPSTLNELLCEGRADKIRVILKQYETRFKTTWKEKHGFDFEDVYNPTLFAEHVKSMMAKDAAKSDKKEEAAISEPQPVASSP